MADLFPLRPVALVAPDPTATPLVADAAALAELLSSSVRSIRTWDAAGKLPAPIRIGGRVVWRLEEIRRWLDAGAPCRDEWEARKALRK